MRAASPPGSPWRHPGRSRACPSRRRRAASVPRRPTTLRRSYRSGAVAAAQDIPGDSAEVTDLGRLVPRAGGQHRVDVGPGGGRNRIGGGDHRVPAVFHPAEGEPRDEPLQPVRPGQQSFKRLRPDVHQIDDQQGIESAGEPFGRLRAFERRQTREDQVGAFELARCDPFAGEPFERAAEVSVAADPGERHVPFIGPHGDQSNGKPLLLANAQRHVPPGLAAVAPGGGSTRSRRAPGRRARGRASSSEAAAGPPRECRRMDSRSRSTGAGAGARHGSWWPEPSKSGTPSGVWPPSRAKESQTKPVACVFVRSFGRGDSWTSRVDKLILSLG